MLKWDPFEIRLHLNLRILGVLCSVFYIQEAITATCINPLEWDMKEHNFLLYVDQTSIYYICKCGLCQNVRFVIFVMYISSFYLFHYKIS